MLILKAFLNENKIDEVKIQNTCEVNTEGQHIYRICQRGMTVKIPHIRHYGWIPLGRKALWEIEQELIKRIEI